MYDVKSLKAEEFISDEEIKETLAYADANKDNLELIDQIIEKARKRKELTHRDPFFWHVKIRKRLMKYTNWHSRSRRISTETVLYCLHRYICPITVSTAACIARII